VSGAVAILAEAGQFEIQHNFVFQMPDVAAVDAIEPSCSQ
jgi:hypothetical protein